MVDNSKDHGKLLPILSLTIVFLRVLTSISVGVSGKIAGREKEKQSGHHHIISMVCTFLSSIALDQSALEKSISYCKPKVCQFAYKYSSLSISHL